jgi:uncharacterized protein YdbL (DUF1318 family)
MPDSEDYKVGITADVSEAVQAFEEASQAAEGMGEKVAAAGEQAAEGMRHAGEEGGDALGELKEHVNESIEKIGELGEGLAGILQLAGLAAVAEAVNKITERLTEASTEIETFAARSQLSLNESRELIASMEAMGLPAQMMTMAFRSLSNDVASGGEKLHKLGVEITDSEGKARSLGEIYEETTEKLAKFGNNSKEAADAQKVLGRSGAVLVSVHEAQKAAMEELSTVSKAVGIDTQDLAEKGNVLRYNEVLLNETWTAFAQSVAPAVVKGFQVVLTASMLISQGFNTVVTISKICGEALIELGKIAVNAFNGIVSGAVATANAIKDAFTGNLVGLAKDASDAKAAIDQIGKAAQAPFQEFTQKSEAALKDWESRTSASSKVIEDIWNGTFDRIAKKRAEGMGGGVSGIGAPDLGKSKGGKGGSKSDPMAGLDNALDTADHTMAQLQDKFTKLGDEAQMAGKEGAASFDQLRQKAVQDYEVMQQRFKELTDAVESGSKQAAQAADHAWHQSAQDFEKDWQAAKQKAEQDMKEIKGFADQMAGDVSGILNGAISGKLNWVQEFDKILSKMLSSLIKHLFEQVAMWVAHEAQVNSVKAAGDATGIAEQKATSCLNGHNRRSWCRPRGL